MLPGALSQLLPAVSLPAVLVFARPGELLGAWLRGCHRPCRVHAGRRALLLGADLGVLIGRCERIAVGKDNALVVLPAERLIARRTLQIVTDTPHLRRLDRLRFLYPELLIQGRRIAVPIGLSPPEAALAACVASRVAVRSSWIDYRC